MKIPRSNSDRHCRPQWPPAFGCSPGANFTQKAWMAPLSFMLDDQMTIFWFLRHHFLYFFLWLQNALFFSGEEWLAKKLYWNIHFNEQTYKQGGGHLGLRPEQPPLPSWMRTIRGSSGLRHTAPSWLGGGWSLGGHSGLWHWAQKVK